MQAAKHEHSKQRREVKKSKGNEGGKKKHDDSCQPWVWCRTACNCTADGREIIDFRNKIKTSTLPRGHRLFKFECCYQSLSKSNIKGWKENTWRKNKKGRVKKSGKKNHGGRGRHGWDYGGVCFPELLLRPSHSKRTPRKRWDSRRKA